MAIEWQDFKVIGGIIARNAAGQFEGRIVLLDAHGQRYALSFVFGRSGANWGWPSGLPAFEVTREEKDE